MNDHVISTAIPPPIPEQDAAIYREAWARRPGARDDAAGSRALEHFLSQGFPGVKLEDWRYTNLEPVRTRSLAALKGSGAVTAAPGTALPAWSGPSIDLFAAGDALGAKLPAGLQGQWVPTAEAAVPGDDSDTVLAFNRAFLDRALRLTTTAGSAVAEPVRIALQNRGSEILHHGRAIITVAPDSSLTLVIHQQLGMAALASLVTEVRVGRNATLRIVRLQESADDVYQLERTRIELEQDATLDLTTLDLGGRLMRHDLLVTLAGTGAAATLGGLFLADGARHLDNHTRLDHRARKTTSREFFRGVLDNSGRGVFNGKIVVHPGAEGTSAELTNRNLLLSRTAEIDTKPELEISVDDVKCSHGATTGQLDPAAMFYLRSRGLGEADARRLLVQAFATEVVLGIPVAGIRSHAERRLAERLGAVTSRGSAP